LHGVVTSDSVEQDCPIEEGIILFKGITS